MSAFDSLRKKAEDAAKAKKKEEEKARDIAAKVRREYKKHEGLAISVLQDMYTALFRDLDKELKKRHKVGLLTDDWCYGIYERYSWAVSEPGRGYDYRFYAEVWLVFDSDANAIGFRAQIGGQTAESLGLSKANLEQLLIKLYEKSVYPEWMAQRMKRR